MKQLCTLLAVALRAIAIEHGALQPDGSAGDGVRRGEASDAAREALRRYDAHAALNQPLSPLDGADAVAHTEGPWYGEVHPDEPNRTCISTNDRWPISLLHNGELTPERQRADLRRIVACVNACNGIPTRVLENAAFASADDETPIYELVPDQAQLSCAA